MGDVIQIGDFKGRVVEIGVRSTKVVNGTNDVKIFNNHEIGSVINYSKRNSVCVVKLSLPITVSLESLKKLFDKELPLVKEANPYIISGPRFNGILEFQEDKMIVSISAEGQEEHIYSIRLELNNYDKPLIEMRDSL